jgi:hypothetical protein
MFPNYEGDFFDTIEEAEEYIFEELKSIEDSMLDGDRRELQERLNNVRLMVDDVIKEEV